MKNRKLLLGTVLALASAMTFVMAVDVQTSKNKGQTSKDYTARELAKLPPEELANFTADELKHIVPTKFAEPKTQYPLNTTESKKIPIE